MRGGAWGRCYRACPSPVFLFFFVALTQRWRGSPVFFFFTCSWYQGVADCCLTGLTREVGRSLFRLFLQPMRFLQRVPHEQICSRSFSWCVLSTCVCVAWAHSSMTVPFPSHFVRACASTDDPGCHHLAILFATGHSASRPYAGRTPIHMSAIFFQPDFPSASAFGRVEPAWVECSSRPRRAQSSWARVRYPFSLGDTKASTAGGAATHSPLHPNAKKKRKRKRDGARNASPTYLDDEEQADSGG